MISNENITKFEPGLLFIITLTRSHFSNEIFISPFKVFIVPLYHVQCTLYIKSNSNSNSNSNEQTKRSGFQKAVQNQIKQHYFFWEWLQNMWTVRCELLGPHFTNRRQMYFTEKLGFEFVVHHSCFPFERHFLCLVIESSQTTKGKSCELFRETETRSLFHQTHPTHTHIKKRL